MNHLAQGGGPTGGLSRCTGDSRGGALVVQEMRFLLGETDDDSQRIGAPGTPALGTGLEVNISRHGREINRIGQNTGVKKNVDGLEFEWEDNITREQYQQYAGEISNYVAAFVAGAIPGSGDQNTIKGFVRYSLEKES